MKTKQQDNSTFFGWVLIGCAIFYIALSVPLMFQVLRDYWIHETQQQPKQTRFQVPADRPPIANPEAARATR